MIDTSEPSPPQAVAQTVSWGELLASRHFGVLAILCFGVWLHAADSLLVATLMPSAVRDIGGIAYLSWTLALYELGAICAASVTGLLVIRTDLRTVMTSAAAVYTVGCVASAMAPDMGVMLAGRILQGVGGGMMLAGTFVGMNRLFPARYWNRVVAAVSAVWGASALLGPLIGGLFASWGIWRGGFWAFAVQSVLVGMAAAAFLGREARQDAAPGEGVPWLRLALLAVAVLAVSAAGISTSLAASAVLCLIGVAGIVLLVHRDGRAAGRMFAARPWSLAHAPGAGTMMVLTSAFATVSFTIYGPVLMQVLYGADPLVAGYYIAAESAAWSVAAIAVSGASASAERVLIVVGSALITLGVVGFAVVMPTGPMPLLLVFALFQGAGFGMAWGFVVRHAIAGAPQADRDRIASSLPTVQMIGYALGSAAAGIVANAAGFSQGLSMEAARSVGVWVFVLFIPFGLLANVAAWRLTAASRQHGAQV